VVIAVWIWLHQQNTRMVQAGRSCTCPRSTQAQTCRTAWRVRRKLGYIN
jgi:hypothetical protein